MDALDLSVVIPVLHDDAALTSLLGGLRAFWPGLEIVVADGEPATPGAREVAELFRARYVPSPPGRGIQMNRGVAAAGGRVLWFLHADSTVYPGMREAIAGALRDPAVAGGAFSFRLMPRNGSAPLLDGLVGIRSRRFHLPFGDQGLFVRRAVFETMGGFRPLPVLEDLDFVRRLKARGRLAILPHPIGVSARRWEAEGFLRATLRNWAVESAWACGTPAERLARWYRPPADPAADQAGNLRAHPGVRVA